MNVVGIDDSKRIELIQILHGLIAKAEDDGLFDMAVCLTEHGGHEFIVLTGRYERDPAMLAQAGFRLQYRAMAAANDQSM